MWDLPPRLRCRAGWAFKAGDATPRATPFRQFHSTDSQPKGREMTPEDLNTITTELKRFGTELNLTDAQKEQLKTFLTEKYQ